MECGSAVLTVSSPYLGVDGHVGRTPLVRLRHFSEATGCEILGKAEFMNPGGSVKDRAALGIILDAEKNGALAPGATIVEGTAGNTGIGLTVIGHARGYRSVIVIPETQSPEKISLLRTLGAEVLTVPEKPYSDPGITITSPGALPRRTGGIGPTSSIISPTGRRIFSPLALRSGSKPMEPSTLSWRRWALGEPWLARLSP